MTGKKTESQVSLLVLTLLHVLPYVEIDHTSSTSFTTTCVSGGGGVVTGGGVSVTGRGGYVTGGGVSVTGRGGYVTGCGGSDGDPKHVPLTIFNTPRTCAARVTVLGQTTRAEKKKKMKENSENRPFLFNPFPKHIIG